MFHWMRENLKGLIQSIVGLIMLEARSRSRGFVAARKKSYHPMSNEQHCDDDGARCARCARCRCSAERGARNSRFSKSRAESQKARKFGFLW